jgi:hypothetical protein
VSAAEERRHRRRRRSAVRVLAAVAAALVIFAVGIALGRALEDNPRPNLTVTTTKTLIP